MIMTEGDGEGETEESEEVEQRCMELSVFAVGGLTQSNTTKL